ncbi:hypothetical protein [Borrelia puertoricensis]|uniref:hypothetical protein n=1 Tax=Borrelia puertoricensis TaxID=2756107 RepID=UPI001FF3E7F1|nr:hypothetical protein [Borrelia puertoricensis]UPA18997.1 hypothetical protein bpuSUM_001538 [Borrelia puertoricensis]
MKKIHIVIVFLIILIFSCNPYKDAMIDDLSADSSGVFMNVVQGVGNLFVGGIMTILKGGSYEHLKEDDVLKVASDDNNDAKIDIAKEGIAMSANLNADFGSAGSKGVVSNQGVKISEVIQAVVSREEQTVTEVGSTGTITIDSSDNNEEDEESELFNTILQAFFKWLKKNETKRQELVNLMKKVDGEIKEGMQKKLEGVQRWTEDLDLEMQNQITVFLDVSGDSNNEDAYDEGLYFLLEYDKDSDNNRYAVKLLLKRLLSEIEEYIDDEYVDEIKDQDFEDNDEVSEQIFQKIKERFDMYLKDLEELKVSSIN